MSERDTDTLDVTDQVTQRRDPRPTDLHILEALRKAGYRGVNDLSRDIGMSHSSLSRVLRGENYEKAGRIFKALAASLNITVDELLDLLEQARVNPLYLHPPVEVPYYIQEVDGVPHFFPTSSPIHRSA